MSASGSTTVCYDNGLSPTRAQALLKLLRKAMSGQPQEHLDVGRTST